MELFKILGTVAIDNENANKSLDETTGKAEETHSRLSGAFGKIGNAAVAVGKVMAAGLAAGAAAFSGLIKQSITDYAEYEQLVGGVETLFKGSSDKVLQYANNAYKTAGMSANQYMDTVTSFSASLLQSLGGDTEAAAEKADMAITDMADNANKMGTDITMIQNAYQGFAKQNFTMLDNLKLGYGGTKEEMQRLLKEAQKISGIKYDISSYADIVDAIHVVQEEMGITGTTAAEASETISGSISTMKGAWTNFIAGMADENQDFDMLLGNLIDSILTVADNLIPRIQALLPRLVEGLNQLINTLLPYLPGIIETLIPGIVSGATALIVGLITALPSILSILLEQIPFILSQIGTALIEAFPVLLETVTSLFQQIWDYIAVGLLGTSADFESTFLKIEELFTWLWEVLQGIWETLGQPVWDLIQSAIEIVRNVFSEKMSAIRDFVSGCFSDIKKFWENNLKPCFDAIGNFIQNTLAPIFKTVFETYIKGTVENVFNAIKSFWEYTLKPVFTGITDFLTGVFTGNWRQAWEGLKSIVTGIFNGIITGIETMINNAINAINGLIEGINKLISKVGSLLGLGGVSIPTIPLLNLPRLEEGGVLEAGQVGLLEGTGAEAVVPLERNKAWIRSVANDMEAAGFSGGVDNAMLQRIIELLETLIDIMPESMREAIAAMRFDINNREFARLVKAVE